MTAFIMVCCTQAAQADIQRQLRRAAEDSPAEQRRVERQQACTELALSVMCCYVITTQLSCDQRYTGKLLPQCTSSCPAAANCVYLRAAHQIKQQPCIHKSPRADWASQNGTADCFKLLTGRWTRLHDNFCIRSVHMLHFMQCCVDTRHTHNIILGNV